jgi:hypothetical protein
LPVSPAHPCLNSCFPHTTSIMRRRFTIQPA